AARALRSREPVPVAQVVEQEHLGFDVLPNGSSVHVQLDDHEPDGASSWHSSFLSQACQYSSTRPSWYLAGYRRRASSRSIGRSSPRAEATACRRTARSSVHATSTAQGTSPPTASTPWFRSKTALRSPSAAATARP